ncbi:PREDICTED: putative DNA helicase Ino80 isoform X1 [Nicrophorus vespilloides]|uniref:Chromatin-remodeling ATPase INO80 n=1 Tax=Nicrophorus vespilloides TaxID=110193 RepID=A0ABM1N7M8_NICVS|nr:PREDICTED: putative DNA helicase Ino80 isoform X1 [Nicrophorus vespilloides]
MDKPSTSGVAKPVHVQRLERALDLNVFMRNFNPNITASDPEDEIFGPDSNWDDVLKDDDAGENPYVNSDIMDMERAWLVELMQEMSNPEEEMESNTTIAEDINKLLKLHKQKKKIATNTSPEVLDQHMYYGAGLISNFDKYHENKKLTQPKPTKRKRDESPMKPSSLLPDMFHEIQEGDVDLYLDNFDVQGILDESPLKMEPPAKPCTITRKGRTKKFKDEESKRKWEDMMMMKRKKSYSNMIKKEVGKQQRAKVNRHKEALLQNKKLAMACQKVLRNKALQSARTVKELQWRMKRLSRENLAYWKRSKRVDREIRRKLEKEAEEQRKIDFELVEAKRQQRKLNFLITQTELYAHFMSKKIAAESDVEFRILSQLEEEKNPRLASIDDYNSDVMKAKAIKNAQEAIRHEKARTKQFDLEANIHRDCDESKVYDTVDGEFSQPSIFMGTLKAYQLRGMNWLANLYDQGISGILADEMGLGKTVQSIAFLSHLAEVQDLWGPFLVICPASTLHNWQQEFAKFVPDFKVVPYWGNIADRKILRQFWHQDGMHTKDAGFHVVITSYQIVISDVKYFNRFKWQYMVLDEAQAIKSTSSMRWKTLLGFNCRNRLLLSGTPIQNSMAELWALLHFIMPTLFDSHEEFNEWFSKDIESHAENKTGIDEKHLSRLHMILKPFMLRRIKKDVENELSDKIEIMVYCPLTTRQRLLYIALKQKIHIEDLLHYTVGGGDSHSVDKNFTSNLMNLVMQFRKVCNHPELFERRDAKSSIFYVPQTYQVPHLIYDYNVRQENWNVIQKYFIFTKEYIAKAIEDPSSLFRFCTSLQMSPQDMYNVFQGDLLTLWRCFFDVCKQSIRDYDRSMWVKRKSKCKYILDLSTSLRMSTPAILSSPALSDFVFTFNNSASKIVYKYDDYSLYAIPETIEHRNIRCRGSEDDAEDSEAKLKSMPEFPHIKRKPQEFKCQQIAMPAFLFSCMPKVSTRHPSLYCCSRRAAYDFTRHIEDWSWTSLNHKWSQSTGKEMFVKRNKYLHPVVPSGPIDVITPPNGWSNITIPDKETLVTDSGKLFVLDGLLKKLKEEGHRVLIYSQMTKMIDLLEEYMWHRHHKYMRLDGSSKISERRDMVADFQARTDIFVFLLSTRAGGLGINLTAADTVIFYDSDWNPTVDQQAMDRAHRLGQTKQVTVYRLICKGSIEERILQRAREKSEIQNLVISGGNFKPETLKPKEVVSLLLDDEEIELKYRQRAEERKHIEDMRELDRKRKYAATFKNAQVATTTVVVESKKTKTEPTQESGNEEQWICADSVLSSPPHSENSADVQTTSDDLTDASVLDIDTWDTSNKIFNAYPQGIKVRNPARGSTKRGRPRGSRRVSALGRFTTVVNPAQCTTSSSNVDVSDPSEPGPSTAPYVPYESPVATPKAGSSTASSGYTRNATTRRGPGRPRLKPSGPPNNGTRGSYRPRKPARPLPVPLPTDAGPTYTFPTPPDQDYTF